MGDQYNSYAHLANSGQFIVDAAKTYATYKAGNIIYHGGKYIYRGGKYITEKGNEAWTMLRGNHTEIVTPERPNKKQKMSNSTSSSNGTTFTQEQQTENSTQVASTGRVSATNPATGKQLTITSRGGWKPAPRDTRDIVFKLLAPQLSWQEQEDVQGITAVNPAMKIQSYNMLRRTDLENILNFHAAAFSTEQGTSKKGAGIGNAVVPAVGYSNVYSTVLDTQAGADNFSKRYYYLKQFQKKYTVRNPYATKAYICITEYVCNTDGAEEVEDLYKQGTARDQVSTGILASMNTVLVLKDATNVENKDALPALQAKGYHYIARQWKAKKQTKIALEPGGLFTYTSSTYNYKWYEWKNQQYTTKGIENIAGLTTCLFWTLIGPNVYDALNGNVAPGNAQIDIFPEANYAGYDGLHTNVQHVKIKSTATTTTYPRTINGANQRTAQESGEQATATTVADL